MRNFQAVIKSAARAAFRRFEKKASQVQAMGPAWKIPKFRGKFQNLRGPGILEFWRFWPDLDDGALDSSLMTNYDCFRTWMMGHWLWSFQVPPSALRVMTNYDRFRTWMMGHWTWSFQVAPSVSRVMKNYDRFRTWMLGHWTCHFEAGP